MRDFGCADTIPFSMARLLASLFVVVASIVVDLCYALVDPRIRYD